METYTLKLTWKRETTRMAKMILKRNNKMEGVSLLNFKTCIDTVIKTVWFWWRGRSMGQRTQKKSHTNA